MGFQFDLNQNVLIKISGETGKIIGRAEYVDSDSMYWLEYKSADGKATSEWFYERTIDTII